MATKRETEKKEAIEHLRKLGLKPGKLVYTACSQVSRSGMSRHIKCYLVTSWRANGKRDHVITDITGLVSTVLGYGRADDGGMRVSGCGMDMGFHVVYSLARTMFPKGGSLDKTHPSRKHQAERAGEKTETDGGYLLRHEWL